MNRYAPGGDLYAKIEQQYGTAAANRVYQASISDSGETIAHALGSIRAGNAADLPTSTAAIFTNQILTDPLAAPLESANNQIGNVFANLFKNPWVLAVVVLAVVYMLYRMNILRFKTRFV